MDEPLGLYGRGGGLLSMNLDILVEKAGGRFRFVTLIQRRMRDLQRGAPAVVEHKTTNLLQTAVEEYYLDKIRPVQGEEAEKLRGERSAQAALRPPRGKEDAGGGAAGASK